MNKTCKCGKSFYVKPSLARVKCCSISCGQKGRVFTEEHLRKLSISNIGKHNYKRGPAWNKGLKGFMAGDKNGRWVSDRTKLSKKQERNDVAYREWRKNVWLRDNFKCKIANPDCKGRIEAHHILGWTKYPELRYELNNGITLCHAHHPRKREDEAKLSPYFQQLVAEMK